eukprot:COSAG02_NODE_54580_length_295_cov_0.795918_1_plen_30_part_10
MTLLLYNYHSDTRRVASLRTLTSIIVPKQM